MGTIGRTLLNTLIATLGGSMAGGAAGGAALALVSNFPDFSKAISLYAAAGGLVIYVLGVLATAFLGTVGGLMFGIVPTLLLGSILSFLRNVPPFGHILVWAIVGAVTGVAITLWSPFGSPSVAHDEVPWVLGWAIGGAASMSVYWAAGIGKAFAKVVR
jgi:hypothetical protein